MQAAYEAKNKLLFEQLSNRLLNLIMDQDRLLGSRKEFLLGRWLAPAQRKGRTGIEKQFYEWNARTLITTWTHELNDVNDYSYREWNGLLKDYYYPRWKIFFADIRRNGFNGQVLNGKDFFPMDKKWTEKRNLFPTKPTTDPVTEVLRIAKKYQDKI